MDIPGLLEAIHARSLLTRRAFLKRAALVLAAMPVFMKLSRAVPAAAQGPTGRTGKGATGAFDLVVAKGTDPFAVTVRAVTEMGGMSRFVHKGDVVVVKPNIGWDRTTEQAANTHPQVVAALVDLAYQAGAKRVKVFDVTCNESARCYANSGIRAAAEAKGAQVFFPDDWNVTPARFSYTSPLEGWPVLKDALECDTFINAPILKHHGLAGLTIGMKNLMGVCVGRRGTIHMDIGRKLADLTDLIRPDLTVVDATRVLVRNGPSGGNLNDVSIMNTVLVGTDPTLTDAYASTLMGKDPLFLANVKEASGRGFGSSDISRARIQTVQV